MKQSKPSVEGPVANALAFLNACPSLTADVADAHHELSADLSELSRLSCLPGLQDASPQAAADNANANEAAATDTAEGLKIPGLAEAHSLTAAKPASPARGLVSASWASTAALASAAPAREACAPENLRPENLQTARELHDAVSQKLFAANLLAGALARSAGVDAPVREQAQVLERLNRSALAEMRMMLFELQPELMSTVRLPELLHQAVEALAGRGGIEVTTDMDDSAPLCPAQRCEVYRIATALLSNIARHSGARHAHLHWSTPLQGPAVLRVCDEGCGFAAEAAKSAETPDSGLTRVRTLATSLGAVLVINSALGEGTEVTLTFHRSPKQT